MKTASTRSEFPETKHYVILTFGSILIPGDERSRTNPGHGYPEHSESHLTYEFTLDREEWVREIARRAKQKFTDFVVFESRPALVSTRVEVEIKS